MKSLQLGSGRLTPENIAAVAEDNQQVTLAPEALERINQAHQYLQGKLAKGGTHYGINTGFGLLSHVKIAEEDLGQLQLNLIRSHACGLGKPLPEPAVRAMLLLRANALCQGHSGVSLGLVQQILAVLNAGIAPVIPEQGSVGASGDLAPLSHLALVLVGEGRATVPKLKGSEVLSGRQALELTGLTPIKLGPKEGLALINGTQFMASLGTLALLEAEYLSDLADFTGAMSLEAMRGSTAAFDPLIHSVRPYLGQVEVAKNILKVLEPSGKKSAIGESHVDCKKVQDPYSLRCMPQVHGASREGFRFIRSTLETEINAVTDNPLVFPDQDKILSGGNFHGQAVAIAMDLLAICAAELASISEQRIQKLINPAFSDLPAFLSKNGGLESGFMIVQVAAASIVSENKTLCHPASVDSIPTSADKEDHVSMGAWAARKATQVVQNTRRVLGLELLAASQGLEFLRPLKSSPAIEEAHRLIRTKIPPFEHDREFYKDFELIDDLIGSQEFQTLIEGSVCQPIH